MGILRRLNPGSRAALLVAVTLPLPSCYFSGHHWRWISRQPKETISLPQTLGVPRLASRLNERSSQRITNLEVWTAVDWNEKLRGEGRTGVALNRESYRVAAGDRLGIQVVDEPLLTKDYYVRPDGTFSCPWVGEIFVEGKTIREVQGDLRKGLLAYMKNPEVIVNLEQGPQRIGVGNSSKPDFGDIMVFGGGGSAALGGVGGQIIPFSGKQTLFNVISSIGGLTGRANWRNVAVFRREPEVDSESGFKTLVIVSDLSNFFKRADFEQNIPLKINDIVFIPTQPEYAGTAFQHDWDLILGYLGGIGAYDEFVRRLNDSGHILPRKSPNNAGD